jgi:uncharacterized protein YjiS (DUF1127 family)
MNTTQLLPRVLRHLVRPRPARRSPGARELRAMSDHELKDLGIGRSEIAYVLEAPGPCRALGS